MPGVRLDVLSNGLTVVSSSMDIAPSAAFVMSYRAGSLWESDENRGLSHFCEHMMFKGSRRCSGTRYWQLVQRNGGISNAFTSRDLTAYFTAVPSCRLSEILEMEADRLLDPLLAEEDVEAEKAVVLEERRSASLDSPTGALDELLFRTAFSAHPYRHPIIGYEEDIRSFRGDAVRSFHERFYSPANAVMALAGDIDGDRVLEEVSTLFGRAGAPRIVKPVIARPEMTPGDAEMVHNSDLPRLATAYQAPAGDDRRSVLLDLLSLYLAGARSSRLEEVLVHGGTALDVSAQVMQGAVPGLFVVRATLYPGVSHSDALAAIEGELEALASHELPGNTVSDLRRQYLALHTISNATPIGAAAEASMGAVLFDDPGHAEWALEVAREATPGSLRAAAAEAFDRRRAAVARLIPSGTSSSSPSRPAPGAPGDVAAPAALDLEGIDVPRELLKPVSRSMSDGTTAGVLGNGARFLLKVERTFPVVAVCFSTPLASRREPVSRSGLAAVTVELMHYGTGDQRYRDFSYRLERLGADLVFSPGAEQSLGTILVPRDDLEEVLPVLSDLLTAPALRVEDFDRVLDEKVTEVVQKRESPFGRALERIAELMSDPPSDAGIPTEDSLRSITVADVRAFHSSCCRPEGTVIAVAGDFDPDSVPGLLERSFGRWKSPGTDLPPLRRSRTPAVTARDDLAMEGKSQTVVLAGFDAPSRDSEHSHAFRLLNFILGDGIGSRIGRHIREELGFAYTAGTEYMAGEDQGRFLAYLATSPRTAAAGLDAVMRVLEDTASAGVVPTELEMAQAAAVARHSMGMSDLDAVAQYLARTAALGRPLDHDTKSIERLLAVTPDGIADACANRLDADRAFVVTAGAPPA